MNNHIPKIFSNIYHSYNATELELTYLQLHMKAVEENNFSYLIKIYCLAEIHNDKEMMNAMLDIMIAWK
jgi:hypothetical protein